MAAPAVALAPPGFAPVSPHRLHRLLREVKELTRTEYCFLLSVVDLGFQGRCFKYQREIADDLHVGSLRWLREVAHNAEQKLNGAMKVYRRRGFKNTYVIEEESLFKLVYPDRKWMPHQPKKKPAEAQAEPVPPKHNAFTRAIARTLRLGKEAHAMETLQAWMQRWRTPKDVALYNELHVGAAPAELTLTEECRARLIARDRQRRGLAPPG